MKKFHKGIATSLCLALALGVFPTASLAAENVTSELQELAEEYITISHEDAETVYSNIQEYFTVAREEVPTASDLDLAEAVLDFTEQDYSDLDNDVILETLDFSEISTVDQIYRTKEDGTTELLTYDEAEAILNNPAAPIASWESDDGYIRLSTTASKGSKTSNGTPFTLSCTATWLKYPAFRLTDTLAIVYTGAFDDSYVITSTFKESGKCSECGKTFNWSETEKYGPEGNQSPHFIENSDMINLDFNQANAIGTKCDLKVISCVHLVGLGTPANMAETTKLTSTIRFRILCNETGEARAAYAHTKLAGTVSISGSVSSSGVTPSFSGALNIIAAKYSAAPVTLRCN